MRCCCRSECTACTHWRALTAPLVCRGDCTHDEYLVYSYLRRGGHIVRRPQHTPAYTRAPSSSADAALEEDGEQAVLHELDIFAPLRFAFEEAAAPNKRSADDAASGSDSKRRRAGSVDTVVALSACNDDDAGDNASDEQGAVLKRAAAKAANDTARSPLVATQRPLRVSFHLFEVLVKMFRPSEPGVPDFACVVQKWVCGAARPFAHFCARARARAAIPTSCLRWRSASRCCSKQAVFLCCFAWCKAAR